MELTNSQNIDWKEIDLGYLDPPKRMIFNQGKVNIQKMWCLAQINSWTWLKDKKSGIT